MSTNAPLSKHLDFAKSRESVSCRNFMRVCGMYQRHADHPTFAMVQAMADDVEKEMSREGIEFEPFAKWCAANGY